MSKANNVVTMESVEKTFIRDVETYIRESQKKKTNVSLMDLKEDIDFNANYIASTKREFIGKTIMQLYEALKNETK